MKSASKSCPPYKAIIGGLFEIGISPSKQNTFTNKQHDQSIYSLDWLYGFKTLVLYGLASFGEGNNVFILTIKFAQLTRF